MIAQSKWLDRKFEGVVPAGEFPCVLERLSGTPARLEELIHHLPAPILTRKAGGGWSIQEHAGHLLDLGELDEARLLDYRSGKEMLTAADMNNRKTDAARHNLRPIGEITSEFRASRLQFVMRLEEVDEQLVQRVSIHPRLQTNMNLAGWCRFIADHDDHHLARISALSSDPPAESKRLRRPGL
jgi:DinB family protein